MKQSIKKQLLCAAAAAFMLTAAATPASAGGPAIEQAKDECLIGEQADGYLGIVPGADVSDALRREVRDINQQRKQVYADIADRNDVAVDVAAALTAQRLISQARPGQCVRGADGAWVEL